MSIDTTYYAYAPMLNISNPFTPENISASTPINFSANFSYSSNYNFNPNGNPFYGGFGSMDEYYKAINDVNFYMGFVYNQQRQYSKFLQSLYTPLKAPAYSSSISKLGSTYAYSSYEPQGSTLKKDKSQYGKAFLKKVKQIAKRLNCNYRDLLGVMNSESGINAAAKNPNGSASGLIQFIESTANSLGTTCAALRRMSPVDQLDYVEKYLQRMKSAAGFSSNHKLSAGELYALVFLPARAKREVLASSGEAYYAANRGLDKNHDGKITKDELGARVKSHYVSDNSFMA